MNTPVVCAISGLAPTEEDVDILTEIDPDDARKELPLGWVALTIEYRAVNEEYQKIALAKSALVSQILSGLPEDQREDAEDMVEIQIDAQFAALEAQKKNAPTLLEKKTLYLAPSDRSTELRAEIKKLFGILGIAVPDPVDDLAESLETQNSEADAEADNTQIAENSGGEGRRRRRRRE